MKTSHNNKPWETWGNLDENNLIYFLLTNGKEEQWIISELFIRESCSRLRSFVTKSKGQAMSEESLWKKGNGLANRHVFSIINLDFVKPRVSHLGWGEYPRL